MQFEDTFQYIGDIGVYQVMLYIMMGMTTFINSFQSIGINFAAGYQNHWCRVSRLDGFPHDTQRYVSVPYKDGSSDEYDNCLMYDLDYGNLTDPQIWDWNRTLLENVSTVECSQGWVYDQTEFVSTINSQYDLVCDRSWMSQFVSTAYQFGVLISSALSGFISDRIGRRKTMLGAIVGNLGLSVGQAFAPNYTVFVIIRCLIPVFNVTAYHAAFVVVMEFIGPKYRTMLGASFQGVYAVGYTLVAGMGYAVRDHRKFFLLAALPIASMLPFIWIVPESPRWLMTRGRYREAERILRNVATINGRHFPEHINWTDTEKKSAEMGSVSLKDVCQSPILCRELCLMYFNWFSTSMIYFGLALNAAAFGSLYFSVFLSGFIEIPATLLCMLCMEKGSKRISNAASLIFAGVFCLSCVPVLIFREDMQILLTVLSTIGKGGITFSFASIYVLTAELFPTPIRHKAIGTSSVFARIGSMISPYMGAPMERIWKPMPSLIFGAVGILAGCVMFLLPETKGHKIPDNIAEAEYIGKKGKKSIEHCLRLDSADAAKWEIENDISTSFGYDEPKDQAGLHQHNSQTFATKRASAGNMNLGFSTECSTRF